MLFYKRSKNEESFHSRENKSQELNKVSLWAQSTSYLRVIDYTHDASKYNEELQDRPPKQQEEANVGLPIY